MYDAYICLRDLKPLGTPGGDFITGDWRTRDLTEEQADTKDICTLAANQFTLPAGTYRCHISCPANRVTYHQTRLYNVTAAAEILAGTCEYLTSSHTGVTRSFIAGRFTLADTKTLEVQHRCGATILTGGFGINCSYTDEIYTIAEFWRELETS